MVKVLKPFAASPKGFFTSVLLHLFWLLLVVIAFQPYKDLLAWMVQVGTVLFFNWQSAQAPLYCTFLSPVTVVPVIVVAAKGSQATQTYSV